MSRPEIFVYDLCYHAVPNYFFRGLFGGFFGGDSSGHFSGKSSGDSLGTLQECFWGGSGDALGTLQKHIGNASGTLYIINGDSLGVIWGILW